MEQTHRVKREINKDRGCFDVCWRYFDMQQRGRDFIQSASPLPSVGISIQTLTDDGTWSGIRIKAPLTLPSAAAKAGRRRGEDEFIYFWKRSSGGFFFFFFFGNEGIRTWCVSAALVSERRSNKYRPEWVNSSTAADSCKVWYWFPMAASERALTALPSAFCPSDAWELSFLKLWLFFTFSRALSLIPMSDFLMLFVWSCASASSRAQSAFLFFFLFYLQTVRYQAGPLLQSRVLPPPLHPPATPYLPYFFSHFSW